MVHPTANRQAPGRPWVTRMTCMDRGLNMPQRDVFDTQEDTEDVPENRITQLLLSPTERIVAARVSTLDGWIPYTVNFRIWNRALLRPT